jgi:Holliday junction DNA helicase RuvA
MRFAKNARALFLAILAFLAYNEVNNAMIYSLRGTLQSKDGNVAIVEIGGVGFKVFAAQRTLLGLPAGEEVAIFTHLNVKEDALDLYGFASLEELRFFELLISVSGVGPKSALAILDIADLNELSAAIQEGRPDLMTKASGIGRKTAERIIIDLKGKVIAKESSTTVRRMEGDSDLIETLTNLGYRRDQAKAAVGHIDEGVTELEARLKAALKILGR